jgi:hypothetical protein
LSRGDDEAQPVAVVDGLAHAVISDGYPGVSTSGIVMDVAGLIRETAA